MRVAVYCWLPALADLSPYCCTASSSFNMYIPANAMTLAWIAGLGSISMESA